MLENEKAVRGSGAGRGTRSRRRVPLVHAGLGLGPVVCVGNSNSNAVHLTFNDAMDLLIQIRQSGIAIKINDDLKSCATTSTTSTVLRRFGAAAAAAQVPLHLLLLLDDVLGVFDNAHAISTQGSVGKQGRTPLVLVQTKVHHPVYIKFIVDSNFSSAIKRQQECHPSPCQLESIQ